MVKKIRELIGNLIRPVGKFFRKGKNQGQAEKPKKTEEPPKEDGKDVFPY